MINPGDRRLYKAGRSSLVCGLESWVADTPKMDAGLLAGPAHLSPDWLRARLLCQVPILLFKAQSPASMTLMICSGVSVDTPNAREARTTVTTPAAQPPAICRLTPAGGRTQDLPVCVGDNGPVHAGSPNRKPAPRTVCTMERPSFLRR